jgi:hypothetical protein
MEVARDIAIIIVALESIVIGILMAILVIQVIRLIRLLREEILPVINSTQETVGTVRGTATFMSEHVVQPVVTISSYAAGVRTGLRTFLALRGRSKPS